MAAGRKPVQNRRVYPPILKIVPLSTTEDLPEPPGFPVCWLVIRRVPKGDTVVTTRAVIKKKEWFRAREAAMKSPGVEVSQLELIQGERDHVDHDGVRYEITPEAQVKMKRVEPRKRKRR